MLLYSLRTVHTKKSATQLKTYRLCPRKWSFQYRAGLRAPTHPSAALGTEVHALAERWLSTGEVFDTATQAGRIFAPGIPHLPAPSPALKIEHHFDDGVFQGYIDVLELDRAPPRVIDHKTTSSLHWALTPAALVHDEQAVLYANEALTLAPDASKVDLRWLYYQTRNTPGAHVVDATLLRADVDTKYKRLVEQAAVIEQTPEHPFDAPGNYASCKAFGGCFYYGLCHETRGKAGMSDLLKKLLEKQAAEKAIAEKAKAEAAAAQVAQAAPEADVNPPEATKPTRVQPVELKRKTRAPSAAPEGFTLYVNCLPMHGAQDLSLFLQELASKVATRAGKEHYRLVEYGGGSALLEQALIEALDQEAITGEVFVDTYARAANDVLGILLARASKVVRGIR